MASDLIPPFPDRRDQGRGVAGYRVRRVTRRGVDPVWEVSGERDGETVHIADFGTEADARWWAATMAREWDKQSRDQHGK